jgi:23S rRNA pseudouridine2605 synthase
MIIKRNASPPSRHRDNRNRSAAATGQPPRHGLARVLSKLGVCSRTQAQAMIRAGRVQVDGRVVLDPETPTDMRSAVLTIDGNVVGEAEKVYIMLNKPRGHVTTASDERGRDTVYSLLEEAELPWLAPVGRLDKASEGLLLFTNDSVWAARLTDPASHVDKTYHVQIDALPDGDLLQRLQAGILDHDEHLSAKSVCELRRGDKNAWLEVVLDEGRYRQIRRLLAAFDIAVLRLVRVAVGELELGKLGKGEWRHLSAQEVAQMLR